MRPGLLGRWRGNAPTYLYGLLSADNFRTLCSTIDVDHAETFECW
jgi:hypothetical protein